MHVKVKWIPHFSLNSNNVKWGCGLKKKVTKLFQCHHLTFGWNETNNGLRNSFQNLARWCHERLWLENLDSTPKHWKQLKSIGLTPAAIAVGKIWSLLLPAEESRLVKRTFKSNSTVLFIVFAGPGSVCGLSFSWSHLSLCGGVDLCNFSLPSVLQRLHWTSKKSFISPPSTCVSPAPYSLQPLHYKYNEHAY